MIASTGSVAELQNAVLTQITEAVAAERRGLESTLRVCEVVLDQVLALPGLPGELRATVRVARGLCLEGLEGAAEEEKGGAGAIPPPTDAHLNEP